jgi:hypothetical protein
VTLKTRCKDKTEKSFRVVGREMAPISIATSRSDTCTFYLLSDLHFLFLGISGSLRRRLSPGPGRCLSTQFERCTSPPLPLCSTLCRGRQMPELGVPLPVLGCRLRISVEAIASSSWSRKGRCCSEPVLVVGLQHANSSSPSLFDVVEESSSSRTSCTSLRRQE